MNNWLWKEVVAPASNLNLHAQISEYLYVLEGIEKHLTKKKKDVEYSLTDHYLYPSLFTEEEENEIHLKNQINGLENELNKLNKLRSHLNSKDFGNNAKDFGNLEIDFLKEYSYQDRVDVDKLCNYLQLVKDLINIDFDNADNAYSLIKEYEYAQIKDFPSEKEIKRSIYTRAEAAYKLKEETNDSSSPEFANEERTLTILINGNSSNTVSCSAEKLCGNWYEQGHTIRGKDICQVSYIGTKNHSDMVNRVVDNILYMQEQSSNKYENIQLCGNSLGGNIAIHAANIIKRARGPQVIVSTSSSPISGTRFVWEKLKSLRFRGKCIAALTALVAAPFYIAANILTLGYVHRSIKNALPKAPDPKNLEKQGITIKTTRRQNDEVVPINAQIKAKEGYDQIYQAIDHNDPVQRDVDVVLCEQETTQKNNYQPISTESMSSPTRRHNKLNKENQNTYNSTTIENISDSRSKISDYDNNAKTKQNNAGDLIFFANDYTRKNCLASTLDGGVGQASSL